MLPRILDNLPVAIPQIRDDGGTASKRYERGFTVGRVEVQYNFPLIEHQYSVAANIWETVSMSRCKLCYLNSSCKDHNVEDEASCDMISCTALPSYCCFLPAKVFGALPTKHPCMQAIISADTRKCLGTIFMQRLSANSSLYVG